MTDTPPQRGVFGRTLAEVLAVWAVFVAFSLVQATVPGVNETHYLAKSRHVWLPSWCAGDLFLESSNPHLVFYRTVGWLASVFEFRDAAVIGRVICLGVLAWGWVTLSSAATGRRGRGALSAVLFLTLASMGNWSGEWVVGGVESKVPAYGLAMAAAGCLIESRLAAAGLLAGLAVSFHPVVGLWFVLAMAGAAVLAAFGGLPSPPSRRRQQLIAAGLFAVASLPGLVPAASLLAGADAELSTAAARYQVTVRLAHHLNPATFPLAAYRGFALTLLLLAVLGAIASPRRRWLPAMAGFATLFAAVGVAVGLSGDLATSDWRVSLLKFYPFRLADVLVPMAACVGAADLGLRALRGDAGRRRRWTPRTLSGSVVFVALAAAALLIPTRDRDSSRLSPRRRADWVETLSWVRRNTPADAVILSTDSQWAVKWYAQREEYANYKDCPQDAESIARWRRRRAVMFRWSQAALADRRVTGEELAAFAAETGVTHLLYARGWPVTVRPDFANDSYRVLRIDQFERPAAASDEPAG